MVTPASLMTWWQMVGRVVSVLAGKAGQAALGMQVDMEVGFPLQVEAVEAMEDQERQQMFVRVCIVAITMVVTAARVFNRPYLVHPIIIMAAAGEASMAAPAAMEDWVAVGEGETLVIQVQHSQEAEVVAPVVVRLMEGQAAPASSSSATRRKPPARRHARRVST